MINDKLIDMHIHTNNSDGKYGVEEIIKRVKENNIGTFSITDHDNIDSISQIEKIDCTDLEFYNGVEISSKYKDIGMHILGYDFKLIQELEKIVNDIQMARKKRCLELIDMLYKQYKIFINEEMINEIINHKVAGKPHVIETLYKLGYGSSNSEIYKKYLKNYKSKTKYEVNIDEVIRVIKKANGLVILAHPKEIEEKHHITIDSILPTLVDKGIDGIEVYNSIHTLEDIIRYLELANKYNLLISGGSDYHGPFVKPDVMLGKVSKDNVYIKELSIIDELRRRNKK